MCVIAPSPSPQTKASLADRNLSGTMEEVQKLKQELVKAEKSADEAVRLIAIESVSDGLIMR
jgi:hypothetical protein